jgi:hypothetical protein
MPVNQKTMQAVQTVQTLIQRSTINFQIVLDLCFLLGYAKWYFKNGFDPFVLGSICSDLKFSWQL